mgnify:FL=1
MAESINLSSSPRTTLLALQNTTSLISRTQERLSTGLKINSAIDDAIAFFQALTQIQEMTLTFVPKIAAIFVTLAISIPFIFSTLVGLSDRVFDLVSNGGL